MYFEQLSKQGIKLRRMSGVEKTTCPQCSESRRNKKDPCLSVNITEGMWNCHNCGWKGSVKKFEKNDKVKKFTKPEQSMVKHIELSDKTIQYFKKRGISKETLDKFMIFAREEWMPQTNQKEKCICFPYFRGDELINIKFRSF